MNSMQRRAWFQEEYGRAPVNEAEIDGGLLRRALLADAKSKAKAERVRAFAEARGGQTLAFAQGLWGHYWGPALPKAPAQVEKELGLSEDAAAVIFEAIHRASRPGAAGPAPAAPDAC